MREYEEYLVNESTYTIRSAREEIERLSSDEFDPRIKAMINSKLQEAELLSLLLIKDDSRK